jgi:hypothetical protein
MDLPRLTIGITNRSFHLFHIVDAESFRALLRSGRGHRIEFFLHINKQTGAYITVIIYFISAVILSIVFFKFGGAVTYLAIYASAAKILIVALIAIPLYLILRRLSRLRFPRLPHKSQD